MLITCVICPLGCRLECSKDGSELRVTGNKCRRGLAYAEQEMANPSRVLTTSVRVIGGTEPLVSVRLSHPIPKDRLRSTARALAHLTVRAPVVRGDRLLVNVLETGADLIATRTVPASG